MYNIKMYSSSTMLLHFYISITETIIQGAPI